MTHVEVYSKLSVSIVVFQIRKQPYKKNFGKKKVWDRWFFWNPTVYEIFYACNRTEPPAQRLWTERQILWNIKLTQKF